MEGLRVFPLLLYALVVILPMVVVILLNKLYLEWRKRGVRNRSWWLSASLALMLFCGWIYCSGLAFAEPGVVKDTATSSTDATAVSLLSSADRMMSDSTMMVDDSSSPSPEELERQEGCMAAFKAEMAKRDADTTAEVRFPEVTLFVSPIISDNSVVVRQKPDVSMIEEATNGFDPLQVRIESDLLTDIHIDQQTSVALYSHLGPEEAAKKSAWRPVKQNRWGKYIPYFYSKSDELRLLGLSSRQLEKKRQAYLKLMDYEHSDEDMDYDISTDEYMLRVTGKRKDTGEIVVRYVRLLVQIGC